MHDWQLLQQYAENSSETAFRAIVERHLNLVHSAALRQVNDPQLAQEVSQAVFILLARKARTFRSGVVLPGWLFRTTRFVAARALRSEHRRQRRELEAFEMQQLATPDDAWRRLAPVLDEALDRLGEMDRNAVVLRFLKDQGHKEVGMTLGLSEEAAKKRVMRALEKLRAFFARRGLGVSTIVLSSALVTHGAKAAPASLAAAVASGSLAGGTTAITALPAMVRETLSAWRWAKAKLAGALCATAVVIALTVNWLIPSEVSPSKDAQQVRVAAPQDKPASVAGVASSAVAAATNGVASMDLAFRVIDSATGAGIPTARIAWNYTVNGEWIRGKDLATDADGICSIPIPSGDLKRLDVGALKDGYVQKFYTWRGDQEESLPAVYVLKLERGFPIGGWVRDESGQPITGAEIAVQFPERGDSTSREPQPERLGFLHDLIAARTDAQGRWKCAIVPAGYDLFSLEIRHPEFVTETLVTDTDDRNYASSIQRLAMKELWATEAVIVLRRGFQVIGLVTDDAGQPVADAKVGLFVDSDYERESATTKADGGFHLAGVAAGPARLSASAAGFGPVSQPIDVQSSVSNLVLRLARGTTVSLRVVDEEGNSIAGAWVMAEGPQRHNADWHSTSDADGWIRFESIPDDVRSVLRFHGGAKDFFVRRDERLDLSVPEPRLQLQRALKVSGRVVDADGGQAVESFKAIPCAGEGSAGYDRSELRHGTNGNYALTFTELQPPFRVRIEAEGYEPAMSSELTLEPRERGQDFQLRRKDVSRAIRGVVLLPEGRPASGAEVALLTFEQGAVLGKGCFVRNQGTKPAVTDAHGRFHFDPDPAAHTIVVVHPSGFGRARIQAQGQETTIGLAPWGRIEGSVRTSDGSWAGRVVVLLPVAALAFSEGGLSLDLGSFSTKADAEGNFAFEQVPADDYTLYLNPGTGKPFTHPTSVQVSADETVQAQIGGTGRRIIGRFVASNPGVLADWQKQVRFASLATKPAETAKQPLRQGMEAVKRWRLEYYESEVGRAALRSQRSYNLRVAADGSFEAEDIPPGVYVLNASFTEESPGPGNDPHTRFRSRIVGTVRHELTVPEAANETMSAPADLGEIPISVQAGNR